MATIRNWIIDALTKDEVVIPDDVGSDVHVAWFAGEPSQEDKAQWRADLATIVMPPVDETKLIRIEHGKKE